MDQLQNMLSFFLLIHPTQCIHNPHTYYREKQGKKVMHLFSFSTISKTNQTLEEEKNSQILLAVNFCAIFAPTIECAKNRCVVLL